ncbi:hypothetical protein LCGC14_2727210 [marine sediment metagenome]|uniref:Uncharacterized protein n=1 Tax=marine sediment metagenome TaxID=412755 RepID=A0A0F8Z8C9_9ZZZZ
MILKVKIYVCQNCFAKNKIIGRTTGRTCNKCGIPLDKPFTPQNENKEKNSKIREV